MTLSPDSGWFWCKETDDDDVSFVGDFDDDDAIERSVFITPPSLSEETSLVSPTDIGGNEFNSSSSSSSSSLSSRAAAMTVVAVVVLQKVVLKGVVVSKVMGNWMKKKEEKRSRFLPFF